MCTLINRVKNVPKEKGFAKKIITAKSAAARTVEFVEIFNVPLSQSLSNAFFLPWFSFFLFKRGVPEPDG